MPTALRPVALPKTPIAATFSGLSKKPLPVTSLTKEVENVCIELVVKIEYAVKICDMLETLITSTVSFLVSVLNDVFSPIDVEFIDLETVSTDG